METCHNLHPLKQEKFCQKRLQSYRMGITCFTLHNANMRGLAFSIAIKQTGTSSIRHKSLERMNQPQEVLIPAPVRTPR